MMYQRRMIALRLILINILLLSIANGVSAWDYLTRSEWKESPLLPEGLRWDMLHLVPGFSGVSNTGIRYTVNEWGYRDDPIEADKRHVVFLGDSTTFGLDVQHEDTYPEVWEQVAGDDWQAVNTGVPGRGMRSSYAILQNILNKGLQLEWVVIGVHPTDPLNDSSSGDELTSLSYLGRSINLARIAGARVLVIYIAPKYDLSESSYFALLTEDYVAGAEVPFINTITLERRYMAHHHLIGIDAAFYIPNDNHHPSALTYRLLGQALAEVIQ